MREFKFLKHEDGSIVRYASGMPVPYDHFDNDPFDEDDRREMLEFCLSTDIHVPEDELRRSGFRKVEGEWRYDPVGTRHREWT